MLQRLQCRLSNDQSCVMENYECVCSQKAAAALGSVVSWSRVVQKEVLFFGPVGHCSRKFRKH